MDRELAVETRTAARQFLIFSVVYLLFMYVMLCCIDVLGWWPGAGLPFQQNVEALMGWSLGLMIASLAAALIVVPLLLINATKSRRPAWSILVALQVFALLPLTSYLRWYDAFGVGV